MQFYRQGNHLSSDIYIFSRQTAKTVFFKKLLPNRHISGRTEGILYMCMSERYDFQQFDLNSPIISNEEIKMLISKSSKMKLLTPEEIDKVNNNMIINDVNFVNPENHLFIENDATDKIKKAYQLEYFTRSLTTQYMKTHLKFEAEDPTRKSHCSKSFNEVLQRLKNYYNSNRTFIDNHIIQIAKTIQYNNLQNDLNELLNTQPVIIHNPF